MKKATKFIVQTAIILTILFIVASTVSVIANFISEHLTMQIIYVVIAIVMLILIKKERRG